MEKCITCHFFDRRHIKAADGHGARMGQCRRCAPLLSPSPSKTYQIEGVWPTVRDDDWCGEWKILPRRPSVAVSAAVAMVLPVPPAELMNLAVTSMAND